VELLPRQPAVADGQQAVAMLADVDGEAGPRGAPRCRIAGRG
jgi:hypothetical protein